MNPNQILYALSTKGSIRLDGNHPNPIGIGPNLKGALLPGELQMTIEAATVSQRTCCGTCYWFDVGTFLGRTKQDTEDRGLPYHYNVDKVGVINGIELSEAVAQDSVGLDVIDQG